MNGANDFSTCDKYKMGKFDDQFQQQQQKNWTKNHQEKPYQSLMIDGIHDGKKWKWKNGHE